MNLLWHSRNKKKLILIHFFLKYVLEAVCVTIAWFDNTDIYWTSTNKIIQGNKLHYKTTETTLAGDVFQKCQRLNDSEYQTLCPLSVVVHKSSAM